MVGDLYAEHILADNMDFVWIDPDNTIDLSKIGDTLDNLPDGEVYARVKTLHLDAGQIKLDENILYASGYDPSTKWEGEDLDDLPDGSVYKRVKSAALSAEGLVLLDQVEVGTYGLVKSTDISAGHIKLDTVVEGTYGLVKSTDISSGHILLSECSGDLDDIANGITYGKVKTTQISGGIITLTSATYKVDDWYEEGGIVLDAALGMEIWGGTAKWHTSGGTYKGCLTALGSGFYVWSNDELYLDASDGAGDILFILHSSADALPYQSGVNNFGTSSYYWDRIYAYAYYGKDTSINSFQNHDDVAMLRMIKHKPNGKLDINSFPEEITEEEGEEERSRQKVLDKIAKHELQFQKDYEELVKKKNEAGKLPESSPEEQYRKAKKQKDIGKRLKDHNDAKAKFDKRKQDTLKHFQNTEPIRAINIMDWQSLLMGSILQLADRLDAIEAK